MPEKKYAAYEKSSIKYKQPKIEQDIEKNRKSVTKSINKSINKDSGVSNVNTNKKKQSNNKSAQIKSFVTCSEKKDDSWDPAGSQRYMINVKEQNRTPSKSAVSSRPKDNKNKGTNNKDEIKKSTNKQNYEAKKFEQLTNAKKSMQNQGYKSHQNSATKTTASKTAYQTIQDFKPTLRSSELPNQETQRLQNLRKYLQDQNHKFQNLKKISDEHIINQMNVSQRNLHMKIVSAENETINTGKRYQKQIEQIHKNFELHLQKKDKQIDALKMQLKQQRQMRSKSEMKVKQSQVLIKCIKEKLSQREKQLQNSVAKYQKQRENGRNLENRINVLSGEKDQIKNMAEGVLKIVREQIMQIGIQTSQSHF